MYFYTACLPYIHSLAVLPPGVALLFYIAIK